MSGRVIAVTLLVEVPDTLAPPNEWDWETIVNPHDLPAHKRTPVLHASSYEVPANTRPTNEKLRH